MPRIYIYEARAHPSLVWINACLAWHSNLKRFFFAATSHRTIFIHMHSNYELYTYYALALLLFLLLLLLAATSEFGDESKMVRETATAIIIIIPTWYGSDGNILLSFYFEANQFTFLARFLGKFFSSNSSILSRENEKMQLFIKLKIS